MATNTVVARKELYDFQTIANVTSSVQFFTQGLSNGRTKADTNLPTAGQLPGDRAQTIESIGLLAYYACADETELASAVADIDTMTKYGALTLVLSNNDELTLSLRSVGMPPPQFQAAIGADAGTGFVGLPIGVGGRGYMLSQTEQQAVFDQLVRGGQTFSLRLDWSKSASALNTSLRVGAFLVGKEAKGLGR